MGVQWCRFEVEEIEKDMSGINEGKGIVG